MNLYPLRFLSKTRGPALAMLKDLRRAGCFRFAHIDGVAKSLAARRLIIGIGQMHPVLQGRFAGFQANRIALTQAAIFDSCYALEKAAGVRSFGQEGFSSPDGSHIEARLSDAMLVGMRNDALRPERSKIFMKRTARLWRKALDHANREEASDQSLRLNGLSLLQAFDPGTTVFPIEDRSIHGEVGRAITELHEAIDRIESTPAFVAARGKGGKNLTEEEYRAVRSRNILLEQFNTTLKSPDRDRAIFQAVMDVCELRRREGADAVPIVFVLGTAHRKSFLSLAKEYIADDTLFVWVTPAPLLFMVRLRRAFIAVVIVAVVAGYFWWF